MHNGKSFYAEVYLTLASRQNKFINLAVCRKTNAVSSSCNAFSYFINRKFPVWLELLSCIPCLFFFSWLRTHNPTRGERWPYLHLNDLRVIDILRLPVSIWNNRDSFFWRGVIAFDYTVSKFVSVPQLCSLVALQLFKNAEQTINRMKESYSHTHRRTGASTLTLI